MSRESRKLSKRQVELEKLLDLITSGKINEFFFDTDPFHEPLLNNGEKACWRASTENIPESDFDAEDIKDYAKDLNHAFQDVIAAVKRYKTVRTDIYIALRQQIPSSKAATKEFQLVSEKAFLLDQAMPFVEIIPENDPKKMG